MVSSRERWDGCGVVVAMGVGTGRHEMTTTWNSLPFLARIRRILLLLATLRHRNGAGRGATIKGKHPCKGVRVGAGRGGGADRSTGVGVGAAGGVETLRTGGGGAWRVRDEGGLQSLRGRCGQTVAADKVQPHPFLPDSEGRSVSLCWTRSSKRHRTILRGPALFGPIAHTGIVLAFHEGLSYSRRELELQHIWKHGSVLWKVVDSTIGISREVI